MLHALRKAAPWPPSGVCAVSYGCVTRAAAARRWRTVLACGDVSSGALGDGPDRLDAAPAYEPQTVQGLPSDVEALAAGAYHNLAVTADGRLWAWGRNAEGQLGPRAGVDHTPAAEDWAGALTRGQDALGAPAEVRGGWTDAHRHVVTAAASGVCSFAVDNTGALWAWGASKRGQLGLGRDVLASAVPRRVEGPLQSQRVVSVHAGWGHTLALCEGGAVYAWGYSAHGRLGFLSPDSRAAQHDAEAAAAAGSLAAGNVQAVKAAVQAADAAVESAVSEEAGVLAGHVQWLPRRVLRDVIVAALACGMDHSVAVAEDGTVYAFGEGHSAAAEGAGAGEEEVDCAVRVMGASVSGGGCGSIGPWAEGPPGLSHAARRVVRVAAGAGHSVALTAGGLVATFGSNSDGQLGRSLSSSCTTGDDAVRSKRGGAEAAAVDVARANTAVGWVTELGEVRMRQVAAGRAHTMAVDEQGRLWGWGSGVAGRLGTGCNLDESVPVLADTMQQAVVRAVACGHDYTLMLCDD